MAKNKINAKAFAFDIQSGSVDDKALMAKHSIPSKTLLDKLLVKLVSSELVTQDDINNRHKTKFKAKDPIKVIEPKASKNIKKTSKLDKNTPSKETKNEYKITGGSFGLEGTLVVVGDTFNVFSTQKISFNKNHVQDIQLSKGKKEKKFSVLIFAAALFLTIIVTAVMSAISTILSAFVLVVCFVATIVTSFHTQIEGDVGVITLNDGKKIELTGKLESLLAST